MKHVAKKNKIGRRHSSIIDEAECIVKVGMKYGKVILGEINSTKSGNRNIKISYEDSGIKVRVRGKSSAQTIFIKVSEDVDMVYKEILSKWEKLYQ